MDSSSFNSKSGNKRKAKVPGIGDNSNTKVICDQSKMKKIGDENSNLFNVSQDSTKSSSKKLKSIMRDITNGNLVIYFFMFFIHIFMLNLFLKISSQ